MVNSLFKMVPLINNKNVSGRKDGAGLWRQFSLQKPFVFPGHYTLCKPPDDFPCSCSVQYPFLFFQINFCWGTVASQCSASFYWISKYISFMYIYPLFDVLPTLVTTEHWASPHVLRSHLFYTLEKAMAPSSTPAWKILYIVMCICPSQPPSSFHSSFPS